MRDPEKFGPSRLMHKAAEALFADEETRKSFLDALMKGESKQQAILVVKDRPEIQTFPRLPKLPWQPDFVVRIAEHFRPGRHPLHAKGGFYSLDFSSVFSASAMQAIPNPPEYVLDLCASPGGKAIFAWKLFQPKLLMCNESVRKRMPSLISNLSRCGIERSQVWSADPSVWARKYPEAFDLIIVDAPCGGQSLLAKGEKAPGAFSPQMIDMCVGRQRRILGHAVKCMRPGGFLLYATCTYAIKENEKIIEWVCDQYPELEPVECPQLGDFQSTYAQFPCYRLFPMSGLGAGAFVCLLKLQGEPPAHREHTEFSFSWQYGDAAPVVPGADKPEAEEVPEQKPERKHYRRKKPEYRPTGKIRRGRRR